VRDCRRWYEELAFHRVYRAVYDFATVDLSSIYFDVLKDRLYTSAPRSHARRSAQTALWRVTWALVRLLAPVLSFTTEEVWDNLRRPAGAPDSVHLALFPEPEELTEGLSAAARERTANWDSLIAVRDTVLKSLEAARQEKFIGAPLEARVRLRAGGDLYTVLQEYGDELPALFIVSQVELEPGGELQVDVERAAGSKCERCWKYTQDIGSNSAFPTVCAACAEAVEEIVNS
jgi:isoleucyl-tRNA synthetase